MSNKSLGFPKEPKPAPRTWEVPPRKVRKLLGMLDGIRTKDGALPRYELFQAIERWIPETEGVITQVKMRGATPFVEEVLE